MIKLKDEIKRVEAVKGNVVPVSKQLYLNLLKEIKLLRFKAHVANDWNLPLKEKEKVYRDITELLLNSDSQKISLDTVVETMLETGRDLLKSYRETAEGGLAKNYHEC